MDMQSHKIKKKDRFAKVKALLPCSRKLCNMHIQQSKLPERSTQISSKAGGRKPRRHGQHRRPFIESKSRIITGQTYGDYGGTQVSKKPPVPRIRSKKRRTIRSNFLSSVSPTLCSFHESADAASASTLSFCSRLGGCHASRPGSSDCVEKPHFELLCDRNPAFAVTEFSHCSAEAAGFNDTPGPQVSPMILVLDSSPEEIKESLCDRKRTKGLEEISPIPLTRKWTKDLEEITPITASVVGNAASNLNDHCVSGPLTSTSSTSTPTFSQEASIFHHKNYESALYYGVEINAIPSSPNIMFQQILNNQSCGLSRLIEAETSRSEMFHIACLKERFDMLKNLRERELGLPVLWGYLDRSHITGINEPHRYFIVIWQIQHASKYQYQLDTLFTAVSLLDRCLSSGTLVNRQMLWLLGVACMCIAVKLEETQFSRIISVMQDICTEAAGQKPCFTKEHLIWMETVVLHIVNFECLRPTAIAFLWHYLQDLRKDKEMRALALTILCLSLMDYEILHFPASIVAASAVFLTCLVLNEAPPMVVVENWTGYADDPMAKCVTRLDFLLAEASGTGRYFG